MSYVLRPPQATWISGISSAFRSHRRVLGVAVTGFGKTVCFVDIAKRTVERNKRVIILAHRIEILNQIAKALQRASVPFSWIAAGRPIGYGLVQIGMVQTVANRLNQIKKPDLVITDEAHHATAGSYRKIMEAWAEVFSLGVTASPQRTDGAGLGDCYDIMVLGPTMRETITCGYLASFTYLAPPQKVDLSNVRTRAGDYAQDQLADAVDRNSVTGDAIEHYRKYLNGRPAIAFCVSVAHAEHVAEQFRAAGWKAQSVDGSTDAFTRADRIAAIGDGRLNVLTSCDIISEGTDIPAVAGALLLRPTQSLIIFLQQCGRVLRLKADGSAAIILDHVGNVFRHGMPDEDRAWTLGGSKKQKPSIPAVRQCPQCYMAFAPQPKCPGCDHVFSSAKPRSKSIKVDDGTLAEVDPKQLAADRAAELKRLIRAASDLPDAQARAAFQAIARGRGYAPGWVHMQMQLRARYGRRAA